MVLVDVWGGRIFWGVFCGAKSSFLLGVGWYLVCTVAVFSAGPECGSAWERIFLRIFVDRAADRWILVMDLGPIWGAAALRKVFFLGQCRGVCFLISNFSCRRRRAQGPRRFLGLGVFCGQDP